VTVQQLLNLLNGATAGMELPRLIDMHQIPFLDNAYKQFINQIDGVPDEEELSFMPGDTEIALPSYVMRVKHAMLSDGRTLKILNRSDARGLNVQTGEIKGLILGVKTGYAKVFDIPDVDTTVLLDVDRMPKQSLEDYEDEPSDIADRWHNSLVDFATAQVMRLSPNPNVRSAADRYEQRFDQAAFAAKRDKALAKSKQFRAVHYGGI
jgi:hypothetical protein